MITKKDLLKRIEKLEATSKIHKIIIKSLIDINYGFMKKMILLAKYLNIKFYTSKTKEPELKIKKLKRIKK